MKNPRHQINVNILVNSVHVVLMLHDAGFMVSGLVVQGSGFRIQDSGFRAWSPGSDVGFRSRGNPEWPQGRGSRADGVGFRVKTLYRG